MEVRLRLRRSFYPEAGKPEHDASIWIVPIFLCEFSMDIAGTERLQIYYFIRGVRDDIASAIVSSGAPTVQAMFERALTYETFLMQKNGLPMTASAEVEVGQSSRQDRRPKRQRDQFSRGRRDGRDRRQDGRDQYRDRQPVHTIAPTPQQRQQPQQHQVRDQGGRDRGQRDRGQEPRSDDARTGKRETRRCFRCGRRDI
ncbi:hypothetical protein Sjap_002222 [Stephania japonica]|uniref:Uncharacterized protein n=1 Tax=Stephania japonica TaxID=461633 RepID=A0AAP0KNR1_9MAGN